MLCNCTQLPGVYWQWAWKTLLWSTWSHLLLLPCYTLSPWEDEGQCCSSGKLSLPLFPDPPQSILDLLLGKLEKSKEFFHRVRDYNNILALASLSVKDKTFPGGVASYKIQGRMSHQIAMSAGPPICAHVAPQPKFMQLHLRWLRAGGKRLEIAANERWC